MTPVYLKRLDDVLADIAAIEASGGHFGKKIITSDFIACQKCDADGSGDCFEDMIIGTIRRACPYDITMSKVHRNEGTYYVVCIVMGFWEKVTGCMRDRREKTIISESPCPGLAAAIAYRDMLLNPWGKSIESETA
jgi:hypothetical protein